MLEVVLRGEGLPGGRLVARAEWSSIDLLMQSPPPPTTWLGVHAVRGRRRPCCQPYADPARPATHRPPTLQRWPFSTVARFD